MKNGPWVYILLHHICRTDISSSYMSLNVTGVSETQIGKLEVKAQRVLWEMNFEFTYYRITSAEERH